MLASQNIQEKFNAAITKLGDILTALAIPVLKIVNPLMDLVNYVLPVINEGFRVMGVMIDYIGSAWNWFVDKLEPIMPVLKGIGIAILAILSPLIAAAGIAAFMAMASIPVIGPVLATAAALGAVSFLTSKMTGIKIQDGMIAPDGGLMVSGKKGTYQLDKNDTVVAGTDLGGGGGRSTGIDIGPLVAEMQNVRAILQQILAKEGSVYIDSTKAGTAFAVGASKLQ